MKFGINGIRLRLEVSGLIEHTEHSEALLESRIQAHDNQCFEAKFDYSIDPNQIKNRYRIQAYFFVPQSLGVSRETYSSRNFFRDMVGYIRFKTPRIPLRKLLDSKFGRSPLAIIIQRLAELPNHPNPEKIRRRLDRELRLLGCLVRANLRDSIRECVAEIPEFASSCETASSEGAAEKIQGVLKELETVLNEYRGLEGLFFETGAGEKIKDSYLWVDEYLSLVLENHLTSLLERLNLKINLGKYENVRQYSSRLLEREREHRFSSKYPQILEGGLPNEHYVYRRGLLKKFVMSPLFLEVALAKADNRLTDFVAAFSAGVAMLFAAYAAIVSQKIYGLNSAPFIAAIVFSYILKDRIKDWIKRYSSGFVASRIWDRDIKIKDPSNEKVVGRCKESFGFVANDTLPQKIQDERHAGFLDSNEAKSKLETCFQYTKDILLNGKLIGDQHARLLDINDIFRFSVAHFLLRADDPEQSVRLFNVKRGEVQTVTCPKVYHLNLVLKLSYGERFQEERIERVRVIVDRKGIRQLEHFEGSSGHS